MDWVKERAFDYQEDFEERPRRITARWRSDGRMFYVNVYKDNQNTLSIWNALLEEVGLEPETEEGFDKEFTSFMQKKNGTEASLQILELKWVKEANRDFEEGELKRRATTRLRSDGAMYYLNWTPQHDPSSERMEKTFAKFLSEEIQFPPVTPEWFSVHLSNVRDL